jgi:HlyD family secretion protein
VGDVLVQFDGSSAGLLPDTNVTVTVTTSNDPDALSIPREALHVNPENGSTYVFKVINDSLVRTPVTTGTFNVTRQAILSGLKEGDWVAKGTSNGQPLQEGVPIKVLR